MRNPRLRNTLVFAGVILFVEIMWTPPVFSALILLVSLGLAPFNFTILYFKKERDVIFFSVKQLIVFLLLVIISSAVFLFDLNKAESKASEIVSACEEYKNEKGLYPESIGELKNYLLKTDDYVGFRYIKTKNDSAPILMFPSKYFRYHYDFSNARYGVLD